MTLTTADGNKVKGRLIEVSPDQIVLSMKDGPRTITTPQITKVQKRENGVLLGALLGADVSLPLVAYAGRDEGGDPRLVLLAGMGLFVGIGIDAAIGSNKTLYDRNSKSRVTVAPTVDRNGGVGARLVIKF